MSPPPSPSSPIPHPLSPTSPSHAPIPPPHSPTPPSHSPILPTQSPIPSPPSQTPSPIPQPPSPIPQPPSPIPLPKSPTPLPSTSIPLTLPSGYLQSQPLHLLTTWAQTTQATQPSIPEPTLTPVSRPTPPCNLDVEFAAHIATHFTPWAMTISASAPTPIPTPPAPTPLPTPFTSQPSAPSTIPSAQPSTSQQSNPWAAAAHYFAPISMQLESRLDRAILLLERITTHLSLLQVSQQDGFHELSFRHDTHDISTNTTAKETIVSYILHT